ncbi:MAG TPA: hypothetical protein VK845_12005 [Gemmatimonadales bacterium]|nr:hypothetical protein [Gemmatimonadales bacterium]
MNRRPQCSAQKTAARAVAIALITLGTASCGAGETIPDGIQRRDSNGVSIVENHSPQWDTADAWRLSSEPLLSLGEVSNDPAYEFTEVVDARLGPDGGIVAADLMQAEVRFFSQDGKVRRIFGRAGEGPGEFQRIQSVGVIGDSTWVFDRGLQRVTWIPTSEGDAAVVNLRPPWRALLRGRLADGTWLVTPLFDLPAPGEQIDGGIHRGRLPLLRYESDGQLRDTISMIPGTEMVYVSQDGELRPWGLPPFGRRPAVAVGGTGIYVGDQNRFEIREYDLSGQLIRIIRLPDADLTISDEEYTTVLEGRVAGAPAQFRSVVRSILYDLPRATRRPAYADFVVDHGGNIWVASLPAPDRPHRGRNLWGSNWRVFSPDGAWLGTVTLPQHFQPTDIGDDTILGIFVDSLGVNQVRLYELTKRTR